MINFDFDPSTLEEVTTANARVNYDLRFSSKTGKFTISEEAFVRFNMNDNGFNLFLDPSSKTPILALAENESATIHKGRKGSERKGNQFTANSLVSMLDLKEEDVEYNMVSEEMNGVTYIVLERIGEEEEVEDSITSEEPESINADASEEFTTEDTITDGYV
jgi:hypothetical protein